MNAATRVMRQWFTTAPLLPLPHPDGAMRYRSAFAYRGTPPRLRRPFKDRLYLTVIRGKLGYVDRVRLR